MPERLNWSDLSLRRVTDRQVEKLCKQEHGLSMEVREDRACGPQTGDENPFWKWWPVWVSNASFWQWLPSSKWRLENYMTFALPVSDMKGYGGDNPLQGCSRPRRGSTSGCSLSSGGLQRSEMGMINLILNSAAFRTTEMILKIAYRIM